MTLSDKGTPRNLLNALFGGYIFSILYVIYEHICTNLTYKTKNVPSALCVEIKRSTLYHICLKCDSSIYNSLNIIMVYYSFI